MFTFGELLRALREARYLTQAQLAEAAGLSRRGIQDLERGVRLAPHLQTIRRLGEALQLGEADRAALGAASRPDAVSDRAAVVSEALPHPTNLTVPLTSFVGRDAEVGRLGELLSSTRLLTLTGPGGVGKTRLALRVATEALANHPDGVWLVHLDPLADADLVPAAVGSVLNVREQPNRPLIENLVDHVADRSLLLVLDNCEHLITACAELTLALLQGCADLRILATSREPLSISGEVAWRVQPLSVPITEAVPEPEALAGSEAVRLFVQRAAAGQPNFALSPHNAAAVAEICRRLDGIPLALELAAARLPAMGVRGIVTHLDDRFRLLSGASRSAVSRQQTLWAALNWSYLLLSDREQLLLERMSAFAGGCTLEGAEGVCSDDPPAVNAADSSERIAARAVLELVSNLVAKSLVVAEPDVEGSVRYHLLESVRAFAQERLAERGETARIRRRHAAYFLALAESAGPRLRGSGQALSLHRLEQDRGNLRIALDWAFERGDALLGLRLGGALGRFWYVRGHLDEGRSYLERMLALPATPEDAGPRALALNAAGNLAWTLGDFEHADTLLRRSLELWRALGDQRGIAISLYDLSKVAVDLGDADASRSLAEEALALSRLLDDTWGTAATLNLLGELRREQGDLQSARSLYEQSLGLFRAAADDRGRAVVTHNLAIVAAAQGDYEGAANLHRAILPLKRELGDREGIVCSLINLAHLGLILGASEYAARLCGAAETERARIGAILPAHERTAFGYTVEAAREALAHPSFDAAWAAGSGMDLDSAIAMALARLARDPIRRRPARTTRAQ